MKGKTVIVLLIVFASVSIAYAIHETIPAETTLKAPGPDATEIYKYITVLDPYNKWQLWPGKERMYKARPPLQFVTTHVNESARYSIRKSIPMIDSSFIITENYDENKTLKGIFLMYKIKDYNPSAGNWYWAQYGPSGDVVASGKVQACIDCHAAKKENDFVFTEIFVK